MVPFVEVQSSRESLWRAIILFGRNVASFKFALGGALLELAGEGKTFVTLEDLAGPYALRIAGHLRQVDKQGTSAGSKFLDTCRAYNRGEVDEAQLRAATAKLGFVNVIDAFHVVNQGEVPIRFFADERAGRKGIALTDELLRLAESAQFANLPLETEARWRLVETAWSLRIGANMLEVHRDAAREELYVGLGGGRRVTVTSSRDALNGYQKGKCFYCFADIAIDPGATNLADVDHFLAHTSQRAEGLLPGGGPLDEVWNLVLACWRCNRGQEGKFARVPHVRYLERLHRRNEFLIGSHHPLRETLLRQTGVNAAERAAFLQRQYTTALERLVQTWAPREEHMPAF